MDIHVGQRVHVQGRKHPTKEGWFAANGVISMILMTSDDPDDEPEPYEVVVIFDEDDNDVYFVSQLEWTDSYGGCWVVQ